MTAAAKRILALAATAVLLGALATMPPELWPAVALVPTFWLWAITGAVVAGLSVTPLVDQPHRWWGVVAWLTAATTIVSLAQMVMYPSAPASNVLTRDIVPVVVLAALLPMAGGAAARVVRRTIGVSWIAVWCCAVVAVAVIAIAPGVWLLAHCSSGDCL